MCVPVCVAWYLHLQTVVVGEQHGNKLPEVIGYGQGRKRRRAEKVHEKESETVSRVDASSVVFLAAVVNPP